MAISVRWTYDTHWIEAKQVLEYIENIARHETFS